MQKYDFCLDRWEESKPPICFAVCPLRALDAGALYEIKAKYGAIQIDGGSEFEALFEEESQRRGIKLFVLPPRSSKLNGGVERAHRTHTEEFYEVTDSTFEIADLSEELLQ